MSTNFSFTKNQKLIIEKLNSLNVEYLVIGGLAVKNHYSVSFGNLCWRFRW
jgi:hypothetical protein